MTLVAAWKDHNTSYLVGDVLVSTRDDFDFEEPHLRVPTRDDLIEILSRENGIRIAGAWQKIYRISDSFAIGWAGHRKTAAAVIKELVSRFQSRKPSLQDVEDSLATYRNVGREDCRLIGFLVENGTAHCFRWISSAPKHFELGEKFIEGTGKEYLREILKPAHEAGKEPLVNSALGKIANLLGHEIYYGTNLKDAFGGWYELIYYDEGFRVLPSVTFIFLSATEGEKNLLVAASRRFLKSQYENGILQTMVILETDSGPPQRALHSAHPIFRDPPSTENEKKVLSLVSDYYAVYVDVTCLDGLQGEHLTTFKRPQKDSILKISSMPDGFELITLNPRIFSRVVDMIKNRNPDRSTYPTRTKLTK